MLCHIISNLVPLTSSIFITPLGANSIGVNPKINNIFNAYHSAKYDLLWISDSNILSKYGYW